MTPTPQQIEAVRRQWPAWDDATIIRHLQQRERLAQVAEQQRRQRLIESMHRLAEVVR